MKAKTLVSTSSRALAWCADGMQILLGSLYIALLSQIQIPLEPIPVTLQTFAIFSLALFQGSRKSLFSLLLYLIEGTLGLPVFPVMHANPLWILSPTAGFLLSFPLAAYVAGKFSKFNDRFSFVRMTLGLCFAQSLIYFFGVSWLSFTIGWKQALALGCYPFVVFDLLKIAAAISFKMAGKSIKSLF